MRLYLSEISETSFTNSFPWSLICILIQPCRQIVPYKNFATVGALLSFTAFALDHFEKQCMDTFKCLNPSTSGRVLKFIPVCITSFSTGILFSSGLIFLKIFLVFNVFLNVFNHAMPEKSFRNFLVRRLTATMSCQGFGHWIGSDSFVYIVYCRCSSLYFKHNSSLFFVH